MITKLLKIKGYRIFKNFVWPAELPPFVQYNVFYGWNGSGKTTLSSLFASIQQRKLINEGEVDFEIDGESVISGLEITEKNLPMIRVFNRDFVRETLDSIKNGNARPIFYLGKANVDEAHLLNEKKKEKSEVLVSLNAAVAVAKKQASDVEECSSRCARFIKTHYSSSPIYLSYDRRKFQEAINKIESMRPPLRALSDEENTTLEKKKSMQVKKSIEKLHLAEIDLQCLSACVADLLNQTVVSNVLKELTSDPPLSRWIQDGLALHSGERHSEYCRFCGNAFSDKRRREFEAHFNDAYARFQESLQKQDNDIRLWERKLDVVLPQEASLYEDLQPEYEKAQSHFLSQKSQVKLFLEILRECLRVKRDRPFEQIELQEFLAEKGHPPTSPELTAKCYLESIRGINIIIESHNKRAESIEDEQRAACDRLVDDYVLSSLPEYEKLKEEEQIAKNKKDELQKAFDLLTQQIKDMEIHLTEHRKPVEELNKELCSYLGRDELSFEYAETGYKLIRGGHVADNISEGESTAITFLYFLKTLEDKDFDRKSGVVVIDDPVSSLDENSLFSAFAYMKSRACDCGQLFILTHNFSFFRQVKNWMWHMQGQKKKRTSGHPCHFYSLRNSSINNYRTVEIVEMDQLLLRFESEYHFLFKSLFDISRSIKEEGLINCYNVPNMARRLLETFLAHYIPNIQGELFKKMNNVLYDERVKVRIVRFLNTYSHAAVLSEPEHDPTVLSETREVVKEMLEMIKGLDRQHYDGMKSLIEEDASSDEEHASGILN